MPWIHSHCNVLGNETSDTLAKEGTKKEQEDRSTTIKEAKTIIKAKQHSTWLQQHPRYNRSDPYNLLSSPEQVALFRLRTGNNRINHQLFTTFGIGQSDLCPSQTCSMTAEHLLQACPLHGDLRRQFWPAETTVARKLFGSLEDLRAQQPLSGEPECPFGCSTRTRNHVCCDVWKLHDCWRCAPTEAVNADSRGPSSITSGHDVTGVFSDESRFTVSHPNNRLVVWHRRYDRFQSRLVNNNCGWSRTTATVFIT